MNFNTSTVGGLARKNLGGLLKVGVLYYVRTLLGSSYHTSRSARAAVPRGAYSHKANPIPYPYTYIAQPQETTPLLPSCSTPLY